MDEIKHFLVGILLLILMGSVGCAPRTDSDQERAGATNMMGEQQPTFLRDYEVGLQDAKESNKPLLLYFTAANCAFSREMNEKTFTNDQIIDLSRNFICVQIDVNSPEGSRICDKLGVSGSPTIQFLSPSGTPLQRLPQKQAVSDLLFQMQAVLYSLAWHDTQLR